MGTAVSSWSFSDHTAVPSEDQYRGCKLNTAILRQQGAGLMALTRAVLLLMQLAHGMCCKPNMPPDVAGYKATKHLSGQHVT
jgi:hypothetical protein